MIFSIKTKIWNGSFFVFLFLTLLSFGFMALANEEEAITQYLADGDQDGLSTEEEKAFGTDPSNGDTDGDSYSDGIEVESGYDPLKPAPGDRIVPDETVTTSNSDATAEQPVNLTTLASNELAALVEEKQSSQEELTSEDLNQAVAKVMENANDEIELPEIDLDKIKIKELSDKLTETERKLKEKEDTLEYLTTLSYILMSNSPITIRSKEDLPNVIAQGTQEIIATLTTGNFNLFSEIQEKSDAILKEIEALEVPENMVGTHAKALQIVGLVSTLGNKLQQVNVGEDPIGQMLEMSKLQGALFTMQGFVDDSTRRMSELGITTVPLDF